MPDRLGWLLLLGILALLPWPAAWAAEPLVLGVPPIHPTRLLVTRYEPLRAYLQQRLGRPALVESAADFRQFHQRTLKGDFTLAITPAHFARLAQTDAGFHPLARMLPDHDALIVTRLDQPDGDPAGLRGGRLAVIDPLAVTVMAALRHLEGQGLKAGVDFQVDTYRSHASAIHALLSGQATAAVSTSQGLTQIPADLRARLRVDSPVMHLPAFVIVARPSTSPRDLALYQRVLLDFPATLEGMNFLGQTGYDGMRAASDAQLARTDPYLEQTRRQLAP